MSHLVNDMIMEDIADKIIRDLKSIMVTKIMSNFRMIWQDMTEIAIERGLHCDDDDMAKES